MIEVPQTLYTRQADIERLEAMVQALPDEAVVELRLVDGGTLTGTVSTRPSVQVFRDADGVEGFNAVVRLDDQRDPAHAHYLWMDRIRAIVRIGSA